MIAFVDNELNINTLYRIMTGKYFQKLIQFPVRITAAAKQILNVMQQIRFVIKTATTLLSIFYSETQQNTSKKINTVEHIIMKAFII